MPTHLTRSTHRRRSRLLAPLALLGLVLGLLGTVPPAQAATCPCTLFGTATPANPAENDTAAVEVGMKFRADSDGFVSGVRFYKGSGNTGTHTGTLWSRTGTQLAKVTFTGETASGWQQATFASPVAVTASTTYVVSYYAPVGRYAADAGAFANSAIVNAPLTGLKNGTDGSNGVYRYGSGGGFPSSTYSSTNYYVDVVYNTSGTDTTKPTVTDKQPAAGATGVAVSTKPTATFSESVTAAAMTLTQGTTTVPSTTAYDSASKTATLTPSSTLAASTAYTVKVSGAKDAANNVMNDVTWSFTTGAASSSSCPCTIWSPSTVPGTTAAADDSAVELGVRFRSNVAGYVTGVRFYKGTGNGGTHIGSLWTNTGTKMSSVAFSNESASGWQTATFSAPQSITAGTTYVVSYYAPQGRYAADSSYFASAATTNGPLTALKSGTDGLNGVYAYGGSQFPGSSYASTNYWVDPVFNTTATDAIAPSLVTRAPAPGTSGNPLNSTVRATFSEPVVAGSVAMELRDPSNALVPASVAYDAGSQTATLTPSATLTESTTYTAKVSGAKDPSNNTMAPDTWTFTSAAPPPPGVEQGPGGPIAVVTSSANPYSKYLAEILRTEGLNEFATIDVSTVSASTLAGYDVVVLGNVAVSSAQVSALSTWVNGGGNLIAIKPGANLSNLLGLGATSGTLSNAYLKVNTATAPGAGIVASSIQFHGTADKYALAGATAVASLYSDASTATANPAVTLRDVGSTGGQAAAFTYDLPQSIALTRQGNLAWAGTERDGKDPVRSDDLFFGGTSAPDWVDFNKIAIPQADEQQRLLANMIQTMNRDKKPLPRFWYFPKRGDSASGAPNLLKAVLVGTGDDHANNGTAGRFNQFAANSPSGCSNADWTCYRYSSYLWNGTPLSNSAAAGYNTQGFEVGLHVNTSGANYTSSSIYDLYADQMAGFKNAYPSLPNPTTTRMHAIVWSDWASQPKAEIANGMRMDTNYYYWPDTWVQDRPGFMTGSGMAQRFTDTDGSMIDNYQAATQMTDESGQTYPYNINTLLDNAQGATGYYGSFVTNFHTDLQTEPESDALLASAQSHNVPIVSARQLTSWLDGRNGSSYGNIAWSGNTLSFNVSVGANATGLTGMLPTGGPNGTTLTGITRGSTAVPFTTNTVKGLDYATFNAGSGAYTATYAASGAAQINAVQARSTAVDAKPATRLSWTTSTTGTSKVMLGTDPKRLTVTRTQGVSTKKHVVPVTGLSPKTRYYYRVVTTDTTGKTTVSPAADEPPASLITPVVDKVAPTLSTPTVTALPGGTAVVRWTTDEAASDTLGLGATAAVALKPVSSELSKEHSVVLNHLEPGKTYYVNVGASDALGNKVSGTALRFTAAPEGVAQQMAASFKIGSTSGSATVSNAGTGSVTLDTKALLLQRGTFASGVLDAHEMVDWDRAVIDSSVPTGAKLVVEVRTGSTAKPDESWSSWATVADNGRVVGGSRYLQYRVTLTSTAKGLAPVLYGIGFGHNGAPLQFEREGR